MNNAFKSPQQIEAEAFAKKIQQTINEEGYPEDQALANLLREATQNDTETSHMQMDRIITDLLEDLGYYEAVEVFRSANKWYA